MRSGKEYLPVVLTGIKSLGRLTELQGRFFFFPRQFIPHNNDIKKGCRHQPCGRKEQIVVILPLT